MLSFPLSSRISILILSFFLTTAGCVPSFGKAPTAKVAGTEIDNTSIKRQSIGNCWIYASLGWVESLHMTATGEKWDLSETYMTYVYFKEVIVGSSLLSEVDAGGGWHHTRFLLKKYGVMHEGDFIPSEANQAMSSIQEKALAVINASLKSGELKNDRSEATVVRELDKAFGVNFSEVSSKAIPAQKVVVGKNESGEAIALDVEVQSWNETDFDDDVSFPDLMRRVVRALNAKKPVVMKWFVDFNALDDRGVFSMDTLRSAGRPGHQGMHMTVLEDYTASGINEDDPNRTPFVIPEGMVSSELQALASKFGNVESFIIKNSWGGVERVDRASYRHDGEFGFARITAEYLREEIKTVEGWDSAPGLRSFILPAGY